MKRLTLAVFLIAILAASNAFAVPGTCDLSFEHKQGNDLWQDWICVGDSGDGTYPTFTVSGFKGYYLYSVETWPGGTTPDALTDFTLTDRKSEDLLGENGIGSIDDTDGNTIIPKSAFMTLNFYHKVKGDLTGAITGNTTHSAIVNVTITGVIDKR